MGLEIRDIKKSYGRTPVLKGINFSVEKGEIHALLGANGAGKSTLTKCISGAITPNSGEIIINGKSYASFTPKSAREAGIAMIYQDLSLAPTLTVTENIFLGQEYRNGLLVNKRKQLKEAKSLLKMIDHDISVHTLVEDLPLSSQQLVEIVKNLRMNPKLLILDEPTAALSEEETIILADQLRMIKKERNIPIIYISHHLSEIFSIADRVTVLRDGQAILSENVAEVTQNDIIQAISGKTIIEAKKKVKQVSDKLVFEAKKVQVKNNPPLDLQVRQGEILGIFGLIGAGKTELLETIFGVNTDYKGNFLLDNKKLQVKNPAKSIQSGVLFVPSERERNSLFSIAPNHDNVLLPSLTRLSNFRFRNIAEERQAFKEVAQTLNLQPPIPSMESGQLSGGNQQKVVVGRWLLKNQLVRLLMLNEPTQGVDVGARAEIYQALSDLVERERCAAIVSSSDALEIMTVSDRIVVLNQGRIVAELSGEEATESKLLELAHLEEEVI